jgi:leucyl aminopeptidase
MLLDPPPMSLTISTAAADPLQHKTDLLVILLREGETAAAIDKRLGGVLAEVAAQEEFSAKEGQALHLHTHGKMPASRVALLGLGKPPDGDKLRDHLRHSASRAVKLARAAGAKTLAISWDPEDAAAEAKALAEGAAMGMYVFDRYKKDPRPFKLTKLTLLVKAKVAAAIDFGRAAAAAVARARDLVNEPAGRITPGALADEARRMSRESGLTCEVFGRAQIRKLKMNLFLGVAQGSVEEPQLVRMTYMPRAPKGAPIALVGKAVTFDSGGLSIKTAQGMEEMKTDMAGAAAVIGAMELVAKLKPPFPVRGYFGACENMPSGSAYKPGDVITGKGGLSVEVLNTDAEGRLVLADVLSWALEEKPAVVIDLATLTGAILVALGPLTGGLFCNDDALAQELLQTAKATGDSLWRMPLSPEVEEQIKSPIADLKNTGGRFGGSISAALFLQHFVNASKAKAKWAHLDIAGPASIDRERGYNSRGATGFGVRLLAEWIARRSA